jgi:hypothetical protein
MTMSTPAVVTEVMPTAQTTLFVDVPIGESKTPSVAVF